MLIDFMKLSTADFPKTIAATAFFGGCNFSCPFCYNAHLIPYPKEKMNEEIFFEYLQSRKEIIEGVCITGGEPTLNMDYLKYFLKMLKNMGFMTKIDTNGSNPEGLEEIINNGLVDYIAMDIKTTMDKYESLTGFKGIDKIISSIEIIKNSSVNHEFRTTINKNYHTIDDIESIASLVKHHLYILQPYKYTPTVLDKNSAGEEDTDTEYLKTIREILLSKGYENIFLRV